MKQRSSGPNRRLFKSGNAAFRQSGEPRVKLFVKQTPSGLVAPFEMPSIRAPVISRRVVPCDAERSVRARKRT